MTFSDVQCEDPANTDTGTSFTCTATGSDGQAYLFTNQAVSTWARAVDGGPSGDTAPALELFRENLVDMVVGVLGAPAAGTTLGALELVRHRARRGA